MSLDLSALTQVHWLDESGLVVKVDAGKLGIELERELDSRDYTLNHSPQSLDRSSVGGCVSTRASGQFSSRYGSIESLVVALTVVLPAGEIVATPLAPRAALGPYLRHVFMGAEGTMGVVVDVTLKIFAQAEHRRLETLRFPNVAAGLGAMQGMPTLSLPRWAVCWDRRRRNKGGRLKRIAVGSSPTGSIPRTRGWSMGE
ncbi:MAG: FAD-binding oxidoreductase [Anaerolineae bacterium]